MAIIKEESKTFPLWFQDETINANYEREFHRCLENLPFSVSQTLSQSDKTDAGLTSGTRYKGAISTENAIYFIPDEALQVMKYVPSTDTISFFGVAGSNYGCRGGVLAPNGKIYCAPASGTDVLIIDTNTDTVSTVTVTTGTDLKWVSGVYSSNGKVYFAPYQRTTDILVFDTTDDTTNYLISTGIAVNTSGGYASGNISTDGFTVYFAPYSETAVLKVDTSQPAMSETVSTFGSFVGGAKWNSSINYKGHVYFVGSSSSILKVDYSDDSNSLLSFSGDKFGSTLHPDGKIYSVPSFGSLLRIFDIEGEVQESSVTLSPAGSGMYGIVTAFDGKMYTSPGFGDARIRILGDGVDVNKNYMLGRFNNKL